MLGDDDLGAALVEIGDDGIAVESHVGDQAAERQPVDQWRYTDRVVSMATQENEAHEIAEGIGQRQGHAALGAAYGLALSPPFAPCPWR